MFFSTKLSTISNLKHCFFSRKNGVSKGIYNSLNCGLNSNDDKKNVIQNINIVCKKLNCEKKPIITLNQTHSNKVVCFNNRNEVKNKIINVHPSLLPSFKGLNAHKRTLNKGVKISIIIGLADNICPLRISIPKISRSIFSACNIQEDPV